MANEMLTGLLGQPKKPQPAPVGGLQNQTSNPQWWKGGAAPGGAAPMGTPGGGAPGATSGYGSITTPPPPSAGSAGSGGGSGSGGGFGYDPNLPSGAAPPPAGGPKPLPSGAQAMFNKFKSQLIGYQQDLSYAQAIGDEGKIRSAQYRIHQTLQQINQKKLNWQNGGYDVSGI